VSQHKGAKGGVPLSVSVEQNPAGSRNPTVAPDVGRLIMKAEWEQARRKAGYWV
jgi:hypothetical protein